MGGQVPATGFDGRLLRPGDDDYDDARTVWNAMVDRRPAVIAQCRSTADVAAAVRFGRERSLEIGVRCGGHSVLGICVPDGGLMIDLSTMHTVRVDPDAGRAWVQGGAQLGALDRSAQRFGLATTAGNISYTGVGGLTLGGGMGWLARRFGLACDNVEAFEVVTADGSTVRASASENSGLFWGLRGGGGNFGVVTEFEFRLHRIGTAALINYFYSHAEAPAALRRWRDLLVDARPGDAHRMGRHERRVAFPSPELHNRPLASAGLVWVGDPDEGKPCSRCSPTSPAGGRERGRDDVSGTPEHRRRRASPWTATAILEGPLPAQLPDAAIDAFLSQGMPEGDGIGDRSMLPAASFSPTEEPSPRCPTTSPLSVIATRWSNSSQPPAGRTWPRTNSG